ncbi:MAG: TonB-dependent receptor [Candidatus Marinimicrobia bacterium]|nr:TonB-dependent receptor [Candidatus Neomarinimicrobiota bacterium]
MSIFVSLPTLSGRRHAAPGRIGLLLGGLIAWLVTAAPLRAAALEPTSRGNRPAVNLNPNISVVVDGIYYHEQGDEPVRHLLEELEGFGHVHGGDDHAHGHDHAHGFEEGFNLRHLELMFAADVDPYFKGWAIVAVEEHGAELEEAVIQTTGLPGGLQLKLGKFFSDFSRQNAMHAHEWNFVDLPLINQLLLGDHGLNEKGVQLSWLAPTPFFLTLGLEVLQGDNENLFAYVAEEEDPLPERDDPRVFLGWAKVAPLLRGAHAVQLGLFGARGVHQEAHLGPDGADDPGSHWLDGHQTLAGADIVYRYTPPTAYGHHWLTLEGGYLFREKDIELLAHNNPERAPLLGNSLISKQDGLYVQGTYGFLPRWRAGLRGEVVGLTNSDRKPDGATESHDPSYRASAMIDWTLTEFSRLRLQVNRGEYETHEGREAVTEGFVQAVFSLGAHGAHRF